MNASCGFFLRFADAQREYINEPGLTPFERLARQRESENKSSGRASGAVTPKDVARRRIAELMHALDKHSSVEFST